MTGSKQKILVPIMSNEAVRNFVDSGALDTLARQHELALLVSPTVTKDLSGWKIYKAGNTNVRGRTKWRWLTLNISMNRHAGRSSTFARKYRETFYKYLPPVRNAAVGVLSMP